MADEHDLIKIPDFVRKLAPTGQEDIPVADETGTYKVNANALIALVAAAQGYLKQASLNPVINNVSGLLADMELVESNLTTKVDKSSIVNNLNSTSSAAVLSAAQGRILKGIIDGFASQVGTGIIGEAKPETVPIANVFGIYTVSTPGVYTNFLDTNGDPIEVLEADLQSGTGGLVQLWGNDNVWEKHVTVIEAGDTNEIKAELNEVVKQEYTSYKEGLTGIDNINFSNEETEEPIITFIDDDTWSAVYTRLYPIFTAKGAVFSSALISDSIGQPGFLTEAQVRELSNYGIEFINHTSKHLRYGTVPDDEWEAQIKECAEWLYKRGYSHDILVNPNNAGVSGNALKIMQRHAKCAFNSSGTNPNYKLNTYNIDRAAFGTWVPGYPTYQGGPLEHYTELVDRCIADNSWTVFMVHVGVQSLEQDVILGQLIDYIQSKGIKIVTASEGFRRRANRLEVNGKLMIGRDGLPTPSLNPYIIEAINSPRLNSSPITDFKNGFITITPFSDTYISGTFGASEFTVGGTLTTERVSNREDTYGKQYFSRRASNQLWMRAWNTNGWNPWVNMVPSSGSTGGGVVKIDTPNSKTNGSLPAEFEAGKITYTQMLQSSMGGAGFPTTSGAVLKTDRTISGGVYTRQVLERVQSNDIWTRTVSSTDSTAWGPWAKVTVVAI